MNFIDPARHTRRAFLRRAGQLAFTGTALPTVLNLAAIGEAAAFNATDYKALVCVFLFGGNDYANTVINYDATSHAQYTAIRGGIAIPRADLAATALNPTVPLPDGKQYALHPSMTGLANLFNTGAAAVQLNVGPLVVPLTRQQYNSNSAAYPRPPKLFSHNDQQSVWMTSAAEGTTTGWGGHVGDLARSHNTNSVLSCISVAGNTVFLSGDQALSYQVSSNGAVRINCLNGNVYGSAAVRAALVDIAMQTRGHALENEYNLVTARAYGTEGAVTNALNAFPANSAPFTNFPANNGLASQLRLVARLIAARNQLGSKRQVFFVSLGGFDLHDNLLGGQATNMERLSSALTAFHQATVDLGVADKVTAFTASDFGRTLTSNGDGSDHGWGSHHLMVGGAVRGAAFYGKAPPVSVTNSNVDSFDQWHVGQGRLLPSTSVSQYAATLARWFGVDPGELGQVLPYIGNFGGVDYPVDMGFMA
ncbi:MAG: DUF1501 domain-containing protein [Hydrogenophaga sp.]|uniref:DUF1501 domain-containing protein n=1 Tax=Hydrogenophaga sp. TaxID=1904254 RepID=UPI0016AE0349|nr:DUF1501 domain-containing protein [Hydrogenophaga sp.]NIM40917.1 DUF1501 domain-containing protein [Hydrogenophaga sp.]NIN24759.1 DUF1501 domain-containing protein [Hydrogenophaga sp.]NIN29271.1 DUF1501 domain-containing protein [Hydrogenophaga sp.]NIN53794.1 DUF1501 domain-containing protein [Hydrogenophaga sp.]NIO53174.1 DUF1501 domain-containing protein [Hydrogenophaga sp.]